MGENLHYLWNVSYFEPNMDFKELNDKIVKYRFGDIQMARSTLGSLDDYFAFTVKTIYPGLIFGSGYLHDCASDDAIKMGFSFDYVTGLPMITGSSVKGILKSCFPDEKTDKHKIQFIQDLIMAVSKIKLLEEQVLELSQLIFGGEGNEFPEVRDVFLGAKPLIPENGLELMDIDYITPHNRDELKEPNPIQILKVKPNITYEVEFLLKDTFLSDGTIVSTAIKKELFKELILTMGFGGKLNVGFGQFEYVE